MVPGWPTVETVAHQLAIVAADLLDHTDRAGGTYLSAVDLQETAVNRASWRAT